MNAYDPSVFNPESLYASLKTTLTTPCPHFVIAYSGGVDSHVLLHGINRLRRSLKATELRAIHINHGLHPQADHWAAHCASICSALDIPLVTHTLALNISKGESLEHVARHHRYQALKTTLKENEILLTAHHQNDQLETLLLQLFRGAGLPGLSAIKACQAFPPGQLMRPLLPFSRQALLEYAKAENLHWIEDTSNQDPRFDRNFLRHDMIPQLEQRWPSLANTVSRSAQHCQEGQHLLEYFAHQDLKKMGASSYTLPIAKLKELGKAQQKNVIRQWFKEKSLSAPSQIKLTQIFKEVINAKPDRTPIVNWGGVEIRRYQHELYALTPEDIQPIPPNTIIPWKDTTQPLMLPYGLGTLTPEILPKCAQDISIRFRQGGERIKPMGCTQHRSLKKYLQEHRIPPWQRARIPLIYQGEVLVGVVLNLNTG